MNLSKLDHFHFMFEKQNKVQHISIMCDSANCWFLKFCRCPFAGFLQSCEKPVLKTIFHQLHNQFVKYCNMSDLYPSEMSVGTNQIFS